VKPSTFLRVMLWLTVAVGLVYVWMLGSAIQQHNDAAITWWSVGVVGCAVLAVHWYRSRKML